ncbi:hypothetical protein LSTR_LSTR014120 [Laodelphax striatellus]|uniref:Uncharacterized protein n=1 Tax=Laodelphax striatellus TaxID=195883 RepID=A0A482XEI0_LAOST|nr:hypothetical protein LSTR_LSTR014120 [Laodelphax striatellus]
MIAVLCNWTMRGGNLKGKCKLALQNCYGIQFSPVGWVGWPGPDVEEWGGALQSVRIGALIIRPVSLCRDAAEGASLHLVSLSLTMDK